MMIKAIINGKLEYLSGCEAKLYSLHGEKAVLNYRNYNEQYLLGAIKTMTRFYKVKLKKKKEIWIEKD